MYVCMYIYIYRYHPPFTAMTIPIVTAQILDPAKHDISTRAYKAYLVDLSLSRGSSPFCR